MSAARDVGTSASASASASALSAAALATSAAAAAAGASAAIRPLTGSPEFTPQPLETHKPRLRSYYASGARTAEVTPCTPTIDLRSRAVTKPGGGTFIGPRAPDDPKNFPIVGLEVAESFSVDTRYLINLWELMRCEACGCSGLTCESVSESGYQLWGTLKCNACSQTRHVSSDPPYTDKADAPVAPSVAPSVLRKVFAMLWKGKSYSDFIVAAMGPEKHLTASTWAQLSKVWAHAVRATTEEGLSKAIDIIMARPLGSRGARDCLLVGGDGMYSVRSLKKACARSPHSVTPIVDLVSGLLVAIATVSIHADSKFFNDPPALRRDGTYFGSSRPDVHSGNDTDVPLAMGTTEGRGWRDALENLRAQGIKVKVGLSDGDIETPLHLKVVFGAVLALCWLHKVRTLWKSILAIGPTWVQTKQRTGGGRKMCSCKWARLANGTEGKRKQHKSCNQAVAEAAQSGLVHAFTKQPVKFLPHGGENPEWGSDDERWRDVCSSWEETFHHITGTGPSVLRRDGTRSLRGALLTCPDQALELRNLVEGAIFSEKMRTMLLHPLLGFMTTNIVETLGASIGRVRTKTRLRHAGLDRMLVWSALIDVQSLRLFRFSDMKEVWLPYVRCLERAELLMSLTRGVLATATVSAEQEKNLRHRHQRNEKAKEPEQKKKAAARAQKKRATAAQQADGNAYAYDAGHTGEVLTDALAVAAAAERPRALLMLEMAKTNKSKHSRWTKDDLMAACDALEISKKGNMSVLVDRIAVRLERAPVAVDATTLRRATRSTPASSPDATAGELIEKVRSVWKTRRSVGGKTKVLKRCGYCHELGHIKGPKCDWFASFGVSRV